MTFDSIMNEANYDWALTHRSYRVKFPDTTEIPTRIILKFKGREVVCKINNDLEYYNVDKRVYVNPNGITESLLH